MRKLRMSDCNNDLVEINVDDDVILGYGGFGSVFPVADRPEAVVKRVELESLPVGDTSAYVAHIRTTRERLLSIKADELMRGAPRQFIVRSINEIVDQSLSTHWCFDQEGTKITGVWFLQRKAPGKCLIEHFSDPPPSHESRIKIARGLLTRMRTLRRADLIHMDCVADNIFVEDNTWFVTLIDLDGCGIVRRPNARSDEWDHSPFTLGHLEKMRIPPWYPQIGLNAGPKQGNYLFGERWVVLDTVIRILTWNKISGSLSWLDREFCRSLSRAYKDIRSTMDAIKSEGLVFGIRDWTTRYETILSGLKDRLPKFHLPDIANEHPPCVEPFMRLAQEASVEPRVLSSRLQPPYDIYSNWLRS